VQLKLLRLLFSNLAEALFFRLNQILEIFRETTASIALIEKSFPVDDG
jgi:hypothetical protein